MRPTVPLFVALLAPSVATAAPLEISPSASVAPAGAPGTGVCAHARHTGAYLGQVTDATKLLDGPLANVTGDTHFFVAEPDLTNGTGASTGDFPVDAPMPFSIAGVPAGDGEKIAIRIRGLVRVDVPGVVTYAVRSDDGFSLHLGGTEILTHPGLQQPLVASRQISFAEPGRYPFEIVYFENLTDAILEWSTSAGAHPEISGGKELPDATFSLLPTSALVAEDDPEACGPTCSPCPGDAPVCVDGSCVSSLPSGQGGAGGSAQSASGNTTGTSGGDGGAGGFAERAERAGSPSVGLFVEGNGMCAYAPIRGDSSFAIPFVAALAAFVRRRGPDIAKRRGRSSARGSRRGS